jgi:hypothetical protein
MAIPSNRGNGSYHQFRCLALSKAVKTGYLQNVTIALFSSFFFAKATTILAAIFQPVAGSQQIIPWCHPAGEPANPPPERKPAFQLFYLFYQPGRALDRVLGVHEPYSARYLPVIDSQEGP